MRNKLTFFFYEIQQVRIKALEFHMKAKNVCVTNRNLSQRINISTNLDLSQSSILKFIVPSCIPNSLNRHYITGFKGKLYRQLLIHSAFNLVVVLVINVRYL